MKEGITTRYWRVNTTVAAPDPKDLIDQILQLTNEQLRELKTILEERFGLKVAR